MSPSDLIEGAYQLVAGPWTTATKLVILAISAYTSVCVVAVTGNVAREVWLEFTGRGPAPKPVESESPTS